MPSMSRMLDVTIVKCEDGMMMDARHYGDDVPMQVPAPDMVTMIDPDGDMLADVHRHVRGRPRCAANHDAGWQHSRHGVYPYLSDDGNNFRMNFPGTAWPIR